MKYLLLSVLLLLGELSASAQHIFAREFPFYNQLSSNEIFSIHQDREGYFWIGTTNGLARYDGHRLNTFRSDYRNGDLLTENSITTIVDNNRYVLIGTWKGMNLYDKQTCRIVPFFDENFQNKVIHNIGIGPDESVWISANNNVYRCDSTAHAIKKFDFDDPGSDLVINHLYLDRSNQLWAVGSRGIFRYDPATDSFFRYPPLGGGRSAYIMCHDAMGNYWIGTWGEGLWQFFPQGGPHGYYKKHETGSSHGGGSESIVFAVEQDDMFGYIWTLSYAGLHTFRYTSDGTLEQVDMQDLIDTHLMYTRICKDREGNLWLSSYDMANTIFFDNSNVDNYLLPQLKQQMGWDANILNLGQSSDSTIWFRQDRYGLCMYHLSEGSFAGCDIGEVNIIMQSRHKPGVWINQSYAPHVMRLTRSGMKVKVEEDINIGGVSGLLEDNDGNLWISTWFNLNVRLSDNNALIASEEGTPVMIVMAKDEHGNVWGVTAANEIYSLNCADGRIHCRHKGTIPVLSAKEDISGICIDRKGCMWLYTTLGSIYRSDETMQNFGSVPLDAIDDCTMLGLLADGDNVWVVTNKKVLQYDAYSQSFRSYAADDENILVNSFKSKAFSPDGRGGLYVGGHRGFIHIRPGHPEPAGRAHPTMHITDVKVEDKSLFFGAADSTGKNTIHRIYLSPDDRNIEIFFSSLSYSLHARHRTAYQLEGVDQDWIYLDHGRSSAFYNHLSRGTYRFRLKLEYEPGKWTESRMLLTIVKEPAFYETWFAFLLYALLVSLCLYTVVRFYIHRLKKKSDQKMQEELARTKLVYFTNVSHELLTPLTVISCISDYLEQKAPAVSQQSTMLKANVEKLKRLIQQVLDFRKMDVGKLRLNVSQGDIGEFILNVCTTGFLPLAQKKNINLDICVDAEELRGYADFDKLDKILYNLLSNALKYTPQHKNIRVTAHVEASTGHPQMVLKVEDEGIGIPARELDHIFTRFYSSKKNRGIESNGIGLSLTKDLVTLHHGTISAESTLGRGSCFTVTLPLDKESYAPDELVDEDIHWLTDAPVAEMEDYPSDPDADKPVVLLIDDNTELLSVMKETFRERYTVLTAVDGQHAWDKLTNNEVDVVLCDVMLPDANGWELCTRIKRDVRYNHIPVIILTAKNGIDDRVASYEAGADGYVAKPFEQKILFARVDNLIKSSRIRQAAFRKEENINLETLAYPSADKQFLQSIIDSIEQHLEEAEFDLEQLSAEMNMSKSTLYRKIKSMTGMTPLDFVRNIKMKRACMMLLARTLNISEIAYAVGFSTPKYFTKCFKEEFGMTPSEYVQKHNQ